LIDGERLTSRLEPKVLSTIPNVTGIRVLIVRCYLEDGQFGKTIFEREIAAWQIEVPNETALERAQSTPIVPGERLAAERWCYFDPSTNLHWEDMGFFNLSRVEAIAELTEGVEDSLRRRNDECTAANATTESMPQ